MRLAALAVIILLAGLAIFAITPAGRAAAGELLQLFARAQGNTLPLPPEQIMPAVPTLTPLPTYAVELVPAGQAPEPTPTPTPETPPPPDAEQLRDLSIVEARYYAGFELYEPARLPGDYRLKNIAYDPQRQTVNLMYASPQAGSGEFVLVTQGRALEPFSVGPDAPVEMVRVGEWEAQLVRGTWFTANGADHAEWVDDVEKHTLRWQAGEVVIEVQSMMNETFSPAYLSRDDLLALAGALERCDPSDPAGRYTCQVGKAAAAAGFTPWQFPAALPGMQFEHTDYHAGWTALWYTGEAGGLGVVQSLENFAAREQDTWFSVPAGAIQRVTVAGQPGEYVKGEFTARPGESQATWDANSMQERLRWKNGGYWFQVVKWGEPYLSPQQVADLAGTLRNAPPSAGSIPQSGGEETANVYYKSVAEAEAAAGFDLLEPGLLPEGLSFSHARIAPTGNSVMLFYGDFAPDKIHIIGPVLVVTQSRPVNASNEYLSLYPPEALQNVQVKGSPGRWIKGSLMTEMAEPGQPTPAPVWDSTSLEVALVWQTSAWEYSIHFNPTDQGARLDLPALLKIAESMH